MANRGFSTDDCGKAPDMQICLSKGKPMVELDRLNVSSETAEQIDSDDSAFCCAATYPIDPELV